MQFIDNVYKCFWLDFVWIFFNHRGRLLVLLVRCVNSRGVMAHKVHVSVCTSVLGPWFGTVSVQQGKGKNVNINIVQWS